MNKQREVYISVDVETSGPIPGLYALLSIGACAVEDDSKVFSCQIKPTTKNADPKALAVTGLSLATLAQEGLEPAEAMRQFRAWIEEVTGEGTPVFVGLNAAFDWAFVNDYFHRCLGENPFGFAPLDIKALYMGAVGSAWSETRSSKMAANLHPKLHGDHDALHDARYQAELFRLIRQKISGK